MNHKYAIEYEGVNGKKEFANTDMLIVNGTPFEETGNAVSRDAVIDAIEWYRANPQHFTVENLLEDIKGL